MDAGLEVRVAFVVAGVIGGILVGVGAITLKAAARR